MEQSVRLSFLSIRLEASMWLCSWWPEVRFYISARDSDPTSSIKWRSDLACANHLQCFSSATCVQLCTKYVVEIININHVSPVLFQKHSCKIGLETWIHAVFAARSGSSRCRATLEIGGFHRIHCLAVPESQDMKTNKTKTDKWGWMTCLMPGMFI